MSMVTPWDLAKYFVFLQVALWYWLNCELSNFMPIILICISIPIKSFQAFKNQTLPVSFPDSATAMWCIQRSDSKTPHVCLYLWQTWHRHKDKIHKTVETDGQNIRFHTSVCVLVVDTLTILPDFKFTKMKNVLQPTRKTFEEISNVQELPVDWESFSICYWKVKIRRNS